MEMTIKSIEADLGRPLAFLVCPCDAGQIVEVAYAAAGEYGVIRRIRDQSDGAISHEIAGWDPEAPEESFAPWNGAISDDGDWSPIAPD